ncbi:branched-chain amino acid transport system permease protein [Symbiobacterium terraclitae]|uniref:Branched-chain amino acid transport system permease protein n=1 Tax=Symbiobacterium terraclitae TaxID=557451 RepID=A0ABS4JRG1_9FIRM|nr:branched-chain amino acid ABC transporter permease [Symbiobacterium terraclitae]MBP2018132.1 branched-chain amino acid transport system permease protein [Symbiobacterium terraclitae]
MSKVKELILPVLLAVAVLAVPLVIKNPYWLNVLILILVWTSLGTAWNILGGYAGQLSLGHSAFFGLGAYTLAITATRFGWNPWLGIALGILLAVPLSLFIGSITFRLHGPYFVLGTLAIAEVLRLVALAWRSVTNGAVGIMVPRLFMGISRAPFYWFIAAVAIVAVGLTWWIERNKVGYYFTAIREDQETAESIGINTTGYKNLALVISAVISAVTGAFYASFLSYIEPDIVLSEPVSLQMAIVAIIGGRGTVLGPTVGATLLVLASELFRAQFKQAHLLIYGLLLMAAILFLPGGVLGTIQQRLKDRRAARLAATGATFVARKEAS